MNNQALLDIIQQTADEKKTVLHLFNQGLTDLPPELFELTHLEELGLSGNQLTTLPRQLVNLSQLRVLYLSNNQLTTLPLAICRLRQLKVLYLSLIHI